MPDFHNMPSRYENFKKAIEAYIFGKAKSVQKEKDCVNTSEKDHILASNHGQVYFICLALTTIFTKSKE